jgi:hypothetical protein
MRCTSQNRTFCSSSKDLLYLFGASELKHVKAITDLSQTTTQLPTTTIGRLCWSRECSQTCTMEDASFSSVCIAIRL